MAVETTSKSHQELVQEMISAGEYTRADIIAKVSCSPGSFASYLTAWRSAAKFTGAPCYPIEVGENKIFQFMTADEAAQVRPTRAKAKAKSKGKNPLVTRDRLEQRILQLSTRIEKLEGAAESEVNSLKITVAKAQRRLLEIEFEAIVNYIDELEDDVFAQVEAEYGALTAKEDEPEDVADEDEAELE
jgi:hypothetical protein